MSSSRSAACWPGTKAPPRCSVSDLSATWGHFATAHHPNVALDIGAKSLTTRHCLRGRARGRALDGDLSRQRMPGASRTAWSALRARGHRGGVPARVRPAAGAGPAARRRCRPGGLPPVGRGLPAAPGSASCPAEPPSSRALTPRLSHAILHGDVACFTARSWPWPSTARAPPAFP